MTQNPKQAPPTPSDTFAASCDEFIAQQLQPWLHDYLDEQADIMPLPMLMLYGRRTANQELWGKMSKMLRLIKDDTLQDASHEVALQELAKDIINWLIFRCVYTPSSDKLLQNPDDVYVAVVRQVPAPQSSMQRLEAFATSTSKTQENAPFDGNDTPTNLSTRG